MEYTIILSDQDLSILNDLLIEAPFKVSAPLINKINAQIKESKDEHSNTNK